MLPLSPADQTGGGQARAVKAVQYAIAYEGSIRKAWSMTGISSENLVEGLVKCKEYENLCENNIALASHVIGSAQKLIDHTALFGCTDDEFWRCYLQRQELPHVDARDTLIESRQRAVVLTHMETIRARLAETEQKEQRERDEEEKKQKKAEEKEKKRAEPYAVGDGHLADLQVSVRQGKTRDQIFKAKKRDELQLVHMVVEQIEVPDKEDEKRCFI